jgi:protein gp37
MAARLKAMGQAKYQADGDPRTSGPGFGLTVHPDTLDAPLKWRKPRRVFVNSMSDLFHKDVPDGFIGDVWRRMEAARAHTFQILTKRPQRMAQVVGDSHFEDYVTSLCLLPGTFSPGWPLPNIWLGTSIENDRYTFRADHLRATPAAVRFLSLEPLLGPLPSLDLTGIDWVIVGGESGPGARPMHPDWVRDIRDRCSAAGIPFFFKQWGAWMPFHDTPPLHWHGDYRLIFSGMDGDPLHSHERGLYMHRLGKKAAGRELDGRTWDEYPA